ncbi:unnamed protein product [Rotaria sordida]|uniref:Uncharacterized protein n=1 Tax=Rotaria sordida TaxID=392033 RepID=A0A819GQM5_9BILA|nr:unnamed protein product [Rotaria sordida]
MTTGQINSSPLSQYSLVGIAQLSSDMYTDYGHPCSQDNNNIFLICTNGTFQCPSRTFFQDSICRRQKSQRESCTSTIECRTDLNYSCLQFFKCGPLSVLEGETVAGYENGTAGNDSIGLDTPLSVYILSDNYFYVTDSNNARVQHYSLGSKIGRRVAGDGTVGSGASQLGKLAAGIYVNRKTQDLYIADNANQRVQLWPINATIGYTVFGSVSTGLNNIIGIRVDSLDNIYVSEYLKGRIVRWSSNTTNLTVIAGNGTLGSTAELLNSPRHIDLDASSQYLYIADCNNHRIQMWHISNNGSLTAGRGIAVAGGNGAGPESSQLNYPRAVVVSYKNGAIYVSDSHNNRVQRWEMNASYGVTIAGSPSGQSGSSASLLFYLTGLALDPNETYLFVCDTGNNRVQRFRLI